MCSEGGNRIYPLTRDHKPNDELEQKRIIEAGGQIYQTAAPVGRSEKSELIIGPYRVLPGRLSVSRTFGDAEAKTEKYGGNPNVVIATPEIKSFKIAKDHDFIVMGSDGIFDKLSNKEAIQCVWNSVKNELALNVHQQCAIGIETILKNSLMRRSLDNVTTLIIGFVNFKKLVFGDKKCEAPVKERLHRAPEVNKKENAEQPRNVAGACKERAEKCEGNNKVVLKRVIPSSTKAAPKKHFDFSRAHVELLETKKNPK